MTIGKLFMQNMCAAEYSIFNGTVYIDMQDFAQETMCECCPKDPPYNCPIWDLDERALLEGGHKD